MIWMTLVVLWAVVMVGLLGLIALHLVRPVVPPAVPGPPMPAMGPDPLPAVASFPVAAGPVLVRIDKPAQDRVHVRYVDTHGGVIAEETIDANQRRGTRRHAGMLFAAQQQLASGIWIYRQVQG